MVALLQEIVAVCVEQAVAAPLASRHLADLGARVIKVERPGEGDFARSYDHVVNGLCSHFVWLNRSKESVALDLKHPDGRAVFERLVDHADVVMQNLGPGAMSRLGLDSDRLRATRPRLVTCDVSGYGSDGPFSDRKAYDLLVQSEVGVLSVTGSPEAPAKAGIPVADIAAGMYAFSGILAALYERERTGQGRGVDVSLFDALAEWMGFPFYYGAYSGAAPVRSGAAHAAIAPYGPFETGDGQAVVLAVQNDREWVRFCELVLNDAGLARHPKFATNMQRIQHRKALHSIIDDRLSSLTAEELEQLLDSAQVAHARMNDVATLDRHPHLVARGRVREIGSPAGSLRALEPPLSRAGGEAPMGPVPGVGEHTRAVLAWVGYSDSEIVSFATSGAVGLDAETETPGSQPAT